MEKNNTNYILWAKAVIGITLSVQVAMLLLTDPSIGLALGTLAGYVIVTAVLSAIPYFVFRRRNPGIGIMVFAAIYFLVTALGIIGTLAA